jgi:hypothetical protein
MVMFPSRDETLARYHAPTGKSEAERSDFLDAPYSPQSEQMPALLILVNERVTPILARAIEIEGMT